MSVEEKLNQAKGSIKEGGGKTIGAVEGVKNMLSGDDK